MIIETMDNLSLAESVNEEDCILEFIDIDVGSGIFATTLDMTSLAAFVYSDGDIRGNIFSSGSSFSDNEDDDTRLTLAYERLHTIPKTLIDRFGQNLQILDISHNKISDLGFLTHFKNLTSLIADNNLIDENTVFPSMPQLELLWLNHCKIKTLYPWIRKLKQSCPNLKHICLMGNPAAPSYLNGGTFYEYLQYRLFVISLFSSLVHLDDRAVTDDQRQEAKRLYRRPLLERLTSLGFGDYSGNLLMNQNTLERWRSLHSRMSNIFEVSSPPSNNNRNVFV